MADIADEFRQTTTPEEDSGSTSIADDFRQSTGAVERTGQDPYVENTAPKDQSWLDRQGQALWRIGGGMVRDAAQGVVDTADWAGDSLVNTLTLHQLPDDFQENMEESKLELPDVEQPVDERGRAIRDIGRTILGAVGGSKGATGIRSLLKPNGYVRRYLSKNATDYIGGATGVAATEQPDDQTFASSVGELTGVPVPEGMEIQPEDSEGMRKLKLFADDLMAAGVIDAGSRFGKALLSNRYDRADELASSLTGRSDEINPKQAEPLRNQGPMFETKAGNINLRNINSTDEIKNILKETDETNSVKFAGARRGKQDWEETTRLAENLGMSTDTLLKRRAGEAFNAEQALRARQLLTQSAQDVMDMAEQIRQAGGSDNAGSELVAEFKKALYRHTAIQEQVTGMTAEAGRALNSFNIRVDSPEAVLKDISVTTPDDMNVDRIINGLHKYKKQSSINNFTRNAVRNNAGDMLKEYWYNSLLSGMSTQTVNVISNALFAGFQPIETGIAAGVGKARTGIARGLNKASGGRLAKNFDYADRIYGVEAAGRAFGLFQGTVEGMRNAARTFFTEMPTDPQTKLEVANRHAIPTLSGSDINNHLDRINKNLRKNFNFAPPEKDINLGAIPGVGRVFREDQQPLNIFQAKGGGRATYPVIGDTRNWRIPGTGEWHIGGQQVRTPGNMLLAGDELFKAMARRSSLWQQGYRKATEQGLKGKQRMDAVRQFVEDPPKDVLEESLKESRYWTFTDQPGAFVKAMMRATDASKVGFLFAPFIRTPARLLHHTFERTPAGLVFPKTREAIGSIKKGGGREFDMAMSRMLTGSSIMAMTYQMYNQGYMTGTAPAEPRRRNTWRMAYQPFSVRFPGSNEWYAVNRVDPLGTLMTLGAEVAKVQKEIDFASNTDAEEDWSFAVQSVLYSTSETLINKTWLQGIGGIAETFLGNKEPYYPVGQLASTVVPTIVAHHTKAMYPQLRDADSIMDMVQARWEGGAKRLNVRLDAFGEPIAFETPAGPGDDKLESGFDMTYITRMVSPIYKKTNPDDKALNEMLAVEYYPRDPGDEIMGVKLNDDQKYAYHAMTGRFAKNRLDQYVNHPVWESEVLQNNPGVKKEIFSRIYSSARDVAMAHLFRKYTDLLEQIPEKRIEELRGDIDRYQFYRTRQNMRSADDAEGMLDWFGVERPE